MDKDIVLDLLNNIDTNRLVGIVPVDVVEFSLKNGLLKRTENGNFELSKKGRELLEGTLPWNNQNNI